MKTYNVILADPPWSFRRKAGKGVADDKYNTMKLCDIMAFPVGGLADNNCVLFMWCPDSIAAGGHHATVMWSWGFTPKTKAFIWLKKTKTGKDYFGCGSYARAQTESCWVGVKGKQERMSRKVRQLITAETREPSRKPDEIYNRIESLYGDVPRVELFARQRWPGWDQEFSDEADKFKTGVTNK